MNTILIGIDPGVNTGFATWDGESLTLDTTTITRAMAKVLVLKEQTDCHIHLFIEDARRRQWFGNAGRERLMGAGSVMRDCRIWEDFCEEQGIQYTLIPPKYNVTKMDAERFAKLTHPKQAFMTMLVYILVGLAGIPVFTGGTAGPGKLFGPTGGYILGFIVAATAIAYLKGKNYNFLRYSIVGLCVWLPVIYGMGAGQLILLTGMNLQEAFFVGVLPFAPLDVLKVVGAAWLAGPIHRIFTR